MREEATWSVMLDLYSRTIDRVRTIVAAVPADAWDGPTPCDEWTVRDLTNHIVGGLVMFGTLAGGGTLPAPDGAVDLLGDDAVAAYDRAGEVARGGFASGGAAARLVPLPVGPAPGEVALAIAFADLTIHGWDLAKATGQDATIPEPFVTIAGDVLSGAVDPDLRRPDGRLPLFAPAIPVGADAPATDRLVAFLGRRP